MHVHVRRIFLFSKIIQSPVTLIRWLDQLIDPNEMAEEEKSAIDDDDDVAALGHSLAEIKSADDSSRTMYAHVIYKQALR